MIKKGVKKPPGRPREFNEDGALAAAMRVFSEKGFEGASLADLQAAMKINRVSMYAAFGNKEALYVKAMERFTQASGNDVAGCLASGSARSAVEKLLREGVGMCTNHSGPGVCFITQGPLQPGEASDETRRFIARKRSEVEIALRRRFERAIEESELPAKVSPDGLARFYSVMIQGIALQAQHGGTKDQLMQVVDVAMNHWPERARKKPSA